jgi:hypothetical protein
MAGLLLELPVAAKGVKKAVAGVAQFADQPIVFGDPLPIHMDDMMDALRDCAARAHVGEPVPISLNGSGRHQNGTSESS